MPSENTRTANGVALAAVAALLAAVVLVAFWPVLGNGFTAFDDDTYVTENPHVRGGLSSTGLVWAWSATRGGNWHPLTWVSHMLDWQLWGADPAGHHLSSLLLHLASTLLLLLVLVRMTGSLWRSAFVAALFGVHPLHVESVAWAAERKDVLSAAFWMLATWAYIRHVRRPAPGSLWVVAALLALGLCAKPMLVTLPFALLLLDYWPLGRWPGADGRDGGRLARALLWEKVPLFSLAAASCVVTLFVQRSGGATRTFETYPFSVRAANAAVAYVAYLGKTIWPDRLAVFYPHPGTELPAWRVAAAAAILILVTAVAVKLRRTQPWLIVGWLWYLGTLLPVVGLVQVGDQAMADRYTYVPLVGVFVAFAWGVPAAFGRVRWLAVAGGLAIAVLVVLTRAQVALWRGPIELFTHAVETTRGNYLAHVHLGSALADRGDVAGAARSYREALRSRPGYASAHYNLGLLLAEQGRLAEAIEEYGRALASRPDDAGTHNNLGNALLGLGRPDEATDHFTEALRLEPGYGLARSNLAAALYVRGEYAKAWREVARARRAGFEPPRALIERLSRAMPEPPP